MILIIDNYDSFIYNIAQYVGEFYPEIKVFRNDKITLDRILSLNPAGIIISPGPGRPEDSKVSLDIIKNESDIPLLGVCLGHQGIAYGYEGEIIGAKNILHGKASIIHHNGKDIFEGLSNPISAIRYHSLVVKRETLPDTLEITAESDDGEIMGLKVKGKDIYGVQFHPESILTQEGKTIIKNFVNIVKKRQEIKHSDKVSSRIKEIITAVSNGEKLRREEAREMMDYIMQGKATPAQVAAYLVSLKIKGETPEEIVGSAESMFNSCVRVETNIYPIVDTCGSGGDKSCSFNISTASAFVVAGAGVAVAKHGNRSMTSKSGSADVLEKLGVNIQLGKEEVEECIREAGIGFIFAPLYHPAMKHVAPVRREIGIRTLFNILGPIVNPAGVKHHVMGVFSKELLELIPPVFNSMGHRHSLVIHGEDGMDEASIEGKTYVKEIYEGKIVDRTFDAREFGLSGKIQNLKVNSPEESAKIILDVLKGKEKGDARKAVVLNAGLAVYAAQDIPLDKAFKVAQESIDSGRAYATLEKLITISNRKI